MLFWRQDVGYSLELWFGLRKPHTINQDHPTHCMCIARRQKGNFLTALLHLLNNLSMEICQSLCQSAYQSLFYVIWILMSHYFYYGRNDTGYPAVKMDMEGLWYGSLAMLKMVSNRMHRLILAINYVCADSGTITSTTFNQFETQ